MRSIRPIAGITASLFLATQAHASAKRSRISGDFNAIGAALRMFEYNSGRFPTTEEGLDALVERPDTLDPDVRWVRLLDEVPVDPWQNTYGYLAGPEFPQGFGLVSRGPDGIHDPYDPYSDDILSWDESTRLDHPSKTPLWKRPSVLAGLGLAVALLIATLFQFGRLRQPSLERS